MNCALSEGLGHSKEKGEKNKSKKDISDVNDMYWVNKMKEKKP